MAEAQRIFRNRHQSAVCVLILLALMASLSACGRDGTAGHGRDSNPDGTAKTADADTVSPSPDPAAVSAAIAAYQDILLGEQNYTIRILIGFIIDLGEVSQIFYTLVWEKYQSFCPSGKINDGFHSSGMEQQLMK